MTRIPRELLEAYRATTYRVRVSRRRHVDLRIGERAVGIPTGALLTAWNPHSRKRSTAANRAAQRRLLRELTQRCRRRLMGEGIGADPAWPPEPSVFAVGIALAQAARLARRHGQYGFVYARAGSSVQLVLLA